MIHGEYAPEKKREMSVKVGNYFVVQKYFLQILQWWARGGFGPRHFLQNDDTSVIFSRCN